MIQSMKGTQPYVFFLDGANSDASFKASDLIYMRAGDTGGGTPTHYVELYFEANKYYAAELTDDDTDTDAQTWALRRNCKIRLNLSGASKAKNVMKTIVSAINSPITVGDPNNRFDRGFIVIADDQNSSYIDPAITAVHEISFDQRTNTDAIV